MGKPFSRELSLIGQTLDWARSLDFEAMRPFFNRLLSKPTIIVGSGGSYSACHFLALLIQKNGGFAKAMTPLELLFSVESVYSNNLVFVSAGGGNTDVLAAFEKAIDFEPALVLNLIMKTGSKLSLLASRYSIAKTMEFQIPTGKDGFLATNSLIGYFSVFAQAYGYGLPQELGNSINVPKLCEFVDALSADFTLHVLYAGWGGPVAVDLESKFTEAGLGNILLADYRNLGHGRHNWFDKKGQRTGVIALITPFDQELATKTLRLIPESIDRIILQSEIEGPVAAIELLQRSFAIVEAVGRSVGIDPGRPGVPEYGSKLYGLNYSSIINRRSSMERKSRLAVLRKIGKASFDESRSNEIQQWQANYKKYISKLNNKQFGALILDYDGTLITEEEKISGPNLAITAFLNEFLSKQMTLGVVTGRGQSVRTSLQTKLDREHWKNVIIGYYNGADISSLADDASPNTSNKPDPTLERVFDALMNVEFLNSHCALQLRPTQITIENTHLGSWDFSRRYIYNLVNQKQFFGVQIVESSHSIDIISRPSVSKSNIITHCLEHTKRLGNADQYLSIGDKGQWPGNDYELLSVGCSISADESSPFENGGWNLGSAGQRGVNATQSYFDKISFSKGYFQIKL